MGARAWARLVLEEKEGINGRGVLSFPGLVPHARASIRCVSIFSPL